MAPGAGGAAARRAASSASATTPSATGTLMVKLFSVIYYLV